MTHEYNSYDRCDYIDDIYNVNPSVNDIERLRRFSATPVLMSTVADTTSKGHGNVLNIKQQQSSAGEATCVTIHRKAMNIRAYSVSYAWTVTTGSVYRFTRVQNITCGTCTPRLRRQISEYPCMAVSKQVTKPALLSAIKQM